jgi:NADPH:quinone reductase-like Zn-dependent oxidoreductase
MGDEANSRKRILVTRPGGYDRLVVDRTPIRDPLQNEVQVQIRACGINFADISVRLGLYGAAKGAYPLCPGLEFAGTVRKAGERVTAFSPGERVFGVSRFGGYASAINCPPEHLWPLPEDWDFSRGAAFPVAYLTAYYALHHVAHLRAGDKVLVHSAAGGVGTALLHLARKHGAWCAGVVGAPSKISAAEAAGADAVIDKSGEKLWPRAEALSPGGYQVILDANGASTLRDSYHHLSPGGRLLVYGFASMFSSTGKRNYAKLLWYYLKTPRFNPFHMTSANRSVSGFNLIHLFDQVPLFRGIMERLIHWAQNEEFPPIPITAYSFEEAAKAHQAMESGKTVGKLVLLTRRGI